MPVALELCAGGGGQAIGFEQAGFDHAALIDNDPHSCASLRINRPYWNVIEADIGRLEAGYWCGQVDVVAAGIPCPPFSIAGKQKGAADERDLFPRLLHFVKHVEPRAVVVENVRGLMARRFEPYRKRITDRLKQLDFSVDWRMLDAYDFGSPQHRTRTFLVAVLNGMEFKWPEPNGVRGGTVGEVLRDMMASDGWERADEWAEKADKPAPTLVGGSKKHGGPDLGPTRAREAWAALGVDGLGLANSPPLNSLPAFLALPWTWRRAFKASRKIGNWREAKRNDTGKSAMRCRLTLGARLPAPLRGASHRFQSGPTRLSGKQGRCRCG